MRAAGRRAVPPPRAGHGASLGRPGEPDPRPGTVEAIGTATEDAYGPDREALTTARDRAETAVLAALEES